MKKEVNQGKSYKGVSSSERFLLSVVRESGLIVFGVSELLRLSDWNKRKVHNTLRSLERKGFISRIKRNTYALKEQISTNPFQVATSAVKPSYLSFWSALSFHGFTDQQVSVIQLVSTKQQNEFELKNHSVKITTFKPERFFGYKKSNGFTIAEKEKALVDSLYLPEKSGGLSEVSKCLASAWSELNKSRFFSYILGFKNKSLNSRTGFLLEELGLSTKTQKLFKNRSTCFVKLNSKHKKTSTYNKRWKIIVNQEISGIK